LFKFITHRPFWVNLLVAIGLIFLMVFLFLWSLDFITHHNESEKVPSVTGKSIQEARKILEAKGFEVEVQDSVYYDSLPRLSIIKQFPLADEMVKNHRTIYLTVNRATPPLIEMPQLMGLSFRHAQILLAQAGLKVGDTTFKQDYAYNSILEQRYKGAEIKAGVKIPKGSKIDMVISIGLGNREMEVPDLIGLTYAEAVAVLESNGLIRGLALPEPNVRDTASAYVYWQAPPRLNPFKEVNRIRPGNSIDVKLSLERRIPVDTLSNNNPE
jgi:eukaryotic-like serine/threonine-protein kinase